MEMPFLPFSRPSIGEEEIQAVNEVLRSGWITTGPKNQELEQRFADSIGCRHAVAAVVGHRRACTSRCWRWASARATK